MMDADTILCGHSLENDLKALRFTHPFLIDTAIAFQRTRNGNCYKEKLRDLCWFYLKRKIQTGKITCPHGGEKDVLGHCSVEDARACLDLVKFKLTQLNCSQNVDTNLLECLKLDDPPKRSAWIDSISSCHQYGSHAVRVIKYYAAMFA